MINELTKVHSNLIEQHKCEIDILKSNLDNLQVCVYALSREIKEIKNKLGGGI